MKTYTLWAAVEVIHETRKPYKLLNDKGFLNTSGKAVLSAIDNMLVDLQEGCTCARFVDMYANDYRGEYREIDSLVAYVEYLAGKETGK